MKLALYKGRNGTLYERITQTLISFWTKSKYTHAELIINGVWYTSSAADGGVRAKSIIPTLDNWDIYEIDYSEEYALNWFKCHQGEKYDYAGVARFIIPILPNYADRWFCFEAVGSMIGIANSSKFTATDLMKLI